MRYLVIILSAAGQNISGQDAYKFFDTMEDARLFVSDLGQRGIEVVGVYQITELKIDMVYSETTKTVIEKKFDTCTISMPK